MADDYGYISADAWAKGIGYSVLASIVGGASKLAIRKSWLMVLENESSVESSTSSNSESLNNNIENQESEIFQDDPTQGNEATSSLRQRAAYPLMNDEHENHEYPTRDLNGRHEKISQNGKNVGALCLRYSGMFGMTFVNPAFCVLAMNYASPSILAPFSGLTLVWIVLFSEHFISEKPEPKQVVAACLIILGQVIVGIFGDHTNDDGITLEQVEDSYKQASFQLFFVGLAIWLSLMTYLMINPPSPTLRRFAWGVSSGSITGFQNFLKDSLSVVKACKANDQALPWYFFILISLAALTAFSGLLILTRCMKRYDATFSSAMFVGSFIISASIMADIHYHTFSNLVGIINYIMYPFGLLVLMVGLYLLVQDTKEPEESIDSDCNESPRMNLPLVSRSEDADGYILS